MKKSKLILGMIGAALMVETAAFGDSVIHTYPTENWLPYNLTGRSGDTNNNFGDPCTNTTSFPDVLSANINTNPPTPNQATQIKMYNCIDQDPPPSLPDGKLAFTYTADNGGKCTVYYKVDHGSWLGDYAIDNNEHMYCSIQKNVLIFQCPKNPPSAC